MADASCSGTTPFKRLIDQQTRDVSHHQDRLRDTSAAHGQVSFRSAPAPGIQAQNNFNAFANGGTALPGVPHDAAGRLAAHAAALEPAHAHPFPHSQPMLSNAATASPAPSMGNWAADFQRFSGQGALPNGQVQQAPLPSQLGQPAPQLNFQAAFAQPNFAFPQMQGGGFMAGSGFMAQPSVGQSDFDQEMSRWMASYGAGSANGEKMKEVDAMMDQVASELELYEAVLPQAEKSAHETATATTNEDIAHTHLTDLETPEIGNLSLDPTPQQPLQQPPSTAEEVNTAPDTTVAGKSAVSEAAERLLESVQHEDGEKWKNSVFLSLMRDFRDGRKDIIDNEIRQTDEAGDVGAKPGN